MPPEFSVRVRKDSSMIMLWMPEKKPAVQNQDLSLCGTSHQRNSAFIGTQNARKIPWIIAFRKKAPIRRKTEHDSEEVVMRRSAFGSNIILPVSVLVVFPEILRCGKIEKNFVFIFLYFSGCFQIRHKAWSLAGRAD